MVIFFAAGGQSLTAGGQGAGAVGRVASDDLTTSGPIRPVEFDFGQIRLRSNSTAVESDCGQIRLRSNSAAVKFDQCRQMRSGVGIPAVVETGPAAKSQGSNGLTGGQITRTKRMA